MRDPAAAPGLSKGGDPSLRGSARDSGPSTSHDREAAAMQSLRKLVRERRGIDLGLYGDSYLQRRLTVRQKCKGCPSLDDFIALLAADSREIDLFLDSFIIRVTEFFRSPRTFAALEEKILPALYAQKREDFSHVMRCWSAGCSSGEEPYSLAIVIQESLKQEKDKFSVLIFATDIDQKGLLAARRGFFDPPKLAKMKSEWKEAYFKKEGEGYSVREEIRRMVVFRAHNLQDPPPFRNLDLILFRNVLIYFSPALQRHLLASFFDTLNPGGYLVLGRTEGGASAVPPEYKVTDAAERIYHRPRGKEA